MDEDGEILEELVYENTRSGIGSFVEKLSGYGECCAVVESTGNLWLKTFEFLEGHGVRVKLANPMKTRAIAEARIKTDRLSAGILAHLLRADLIPESYVPPRGVREKRGLLRHRSVLVKVRTAVRNQVHSLLDKYDLRCEYGDLFGVHGMKWLEGLELQGEDQHILESHLRRLRGLQREVEVMDARIALRASEDEDVRLLMTMTGVGHFTAMLLLSEIGDITRFSTPEKLSSWAGLAPRTHQSGDSCWNGRITKRGNKRVRWILSQSAQTARLHDPKFQTFYQRIAVRRGHSKALVAVCRKMLVVIWTVLTMNEPYHGQDDTLTMRKHKRLLNIASG